MSNFVRQYKRYAPVTMPKGQQDDFVAVGEKTTGPMSQPAEFENKYRAKCAGCGLTLMPGTRVQGIRSAAHTHWYVWHPAASCVAVVRQKGIIGEGVTAAQVHHAQEKKSFEEQLMEAYEKESAGL